MIPADWEVEYLSNLCTKIQDGTHFSPTVGGNDFLYMTSKNIRFGYLDVSNADRIDSVQHEAIYKRCSVQYGDLLLTKDGANTGNAAINNLTEQFSLLSSVAFLRFDAQKHSASHYLQQILSVSGQQQIKEAMSGNAITRLTLEKIRKLQFPVPTPRQRAIAAFSDVDALIGALEAPSPKSTPSSRPPCNSS
jgi:type I restriction enzyme S subunit